MGAECSSLGNTICSDCAAIRPGKKGGHENANTGATGPGEENHVKAEPQRETVAQAERRGFGKLEQQKAFATLQARGPVEGAQRNAARLDNAKLTAEEQALIAARASREAACNTAPGHHRPHHAVRHAAGVVHSHQPHQYDLQLYNLNQQHVVHHQAQQLCQTQQRQSQRFFPEIHHPARQHVHGSSQRRLIDEATGNQPGLRSSAFEVDAEEFQRNVLDQEEADTTEAPAAPGLSATAARVASEFEGAPASLRAVPAGDVCVFVDPVDGTKEFVEGRLGAVQTLIGVSVQGNAVAGAVGIPFMPPYAGEGSGTHVMYGIADVGARNIPAPTGQRPEVDGGAVLVASPSGKEKALGIAKESLKPGAVITPGAPARRARVPPLSPNHPTHTCTHNRGRKLCDALHPSPPSPPSLFLPPSVWQGAWATKSSACCAGTLIVR